MRPGAPRSKHRSGSEGESGSGRKRIIYDDDYRERRGFPRSMPG